MTATAIAPADKLRALRDQVETLQLQDEITQLESMLRHRAEVESLVEDWGDFVDPMDAIRSEPELFSGGYAGRADRPDDRRNGDYAPHFTNETMIARIRGACGWLADTDVTVIGAFDTLKSFIVKQGSTFEVVAKKPEGEAHVDAVKEILDEFTRRTNWYGGIDKESFLRTRKAGTRFLRITDAGDGYAGAKFYEPSWITEPQNKEQIAEHYGLPAGLDWKYGVVTESDDVSLVWGYYACVNGDPKCGEFIPESEMDRMKVNTDSNSKLGLPDLYPGRKWVTKCEKLLERTMDGAAIQASIALRRTYPQGTPNSKVQSAAEGQVEFRMTTPTVGGGSKSTAYQRFDTGTVIDQKGVNYEAGPMGEGHGEGYIAVLDAGLRKLSRRWGITEDAFTGDASNNNRASLVEAGSTSLTRMQEAQTEIATNDANVLWRVVDVAIRGGRIVGATLQQLKEWLLIKVTPADIEKRDRKGEHEIREGEHQAGLLSLATWAAETGRDFEEEQQKRAAEPQPQPPAIPLRIDGLGGFGKQPAPPMNPGQGQALPESRTEALAVRAVDILLRRAKGNQ